jgi:hypothetical protein
MDKEGDVTYGWGWQAGVEAGLQQVDREMTPQERLKILYERVRDFRINEDEVLSELRRLLLVFDGYSEGPRTYYRRQIITVLGQVEECGRLCFETRPIVLGRLHGAAQVAGELIEIKQRATIGASQH